MRIVSQHISNVNGRGQVIAKGAGKQRTTSWNHAATRDQNHAFAVATLLKALGDDFATVAVRNIDEGNASREIEENPDRYVWHV